MLDMKQRIALSSVVRKRYRGSKKKEKTRILNEFTKNTGYNRSYARFILGSLKKKGRKKKYSPRKRIYDLEVFYALKSLWIAEDCICSQRLKPFLPELIRVLENKGEFRVRKEILKKLLMMSSATIDRVLSVTKKSYHLKGRSTTKPGTLLRKTIAVRTFEDWNENSPGYFETDLVALCGETTKGDYVNALNLTDVFLGWVGLEAIMGKAQSRVHPAVDRVRKRLPFPMLGLDPDNGTEFINWLLKSYCENYNIAFTRIRPYRKNDNCYVEQKNYTVVRRFLGYGRYDKEEQLLIIQEILKLVELYVNFFQPVMKLVSKEVIDSGLGKKVKKKYDTAKTPYQRLLNFGVLTQEKKEHLQTVYESLNPLDLRRKIYKLTEKLYKTLR